MTFLNDYLIDKATIGDIDNYVDAWHNGKAMDLTLREYLGFNVDEYTLFLMDSDALYKILNDRKCNE